MSPKKAHEIKLVDNDFLQARWSEIQELLDASFADSDFSTGFATGRPAEHTWEEIHKPEGKGLQHVVALAEDGRVIGAIFCLRTERPENETTCDIGWFFTDPQRSGFERFKITNGLVNCAYDELKLSGYHAVVTEMGTEAGAFYLSRRHGFAPAPTAAKSNRWIKSLRTAAEVGFSKNSAISPQGQGAGGRPTRHATVDIAKGEIVIDFKVVLRGTKHRSADSIQLGDGYFFRSSEGPLGLAHHCSPNCQLDFDDLSFRAVRDIAAGERLTFDYCTTEYELSEPFDCSCGSLDCVGHVAGFNALSESDVERIFDRLSPFLQGETRQKQA